MEAHSTKIFLSDARPVLSPKKHLAITNERIN